MPHALADAAPIHEVAHEDGDPSFVVVVPSIRGRPAALIADLAGQTRRPGRVLVVEGVAPNGRARNVGVAAARDDRVATIVFVDDDARLDHERVLERLLEPFELPGNERLAVVGGAKLLPDGASAFSRRVAAEVPRAVCAEPERPTETNPGLRGAALSEVTTTCCAIRLEALEAVSGFDEQLVRGVDTDAFYRLRRAGWDFLLVPGAAARHPVPESLGELFRLWRARGEGHAAEARRWPERRLGPPIEGAAAAWAYLGLRAFALPAHMLMPVTRFGRGGRPRVALGFRPLAAIASFAAACGYTAKARGGRGR